MSQLNLEQIKIREANTKDLYDIVNLLADDEFGMEREKLTGSNQVADCYIDAYNRIKNDPNHKLIVMDYEGEIIGTLQFIIIPTVVLQGCIRAEVEGVRVKSSYRSFGLGKILFNWIKNTALANNCQLIQLTTNKNRKRAQEFYKSVGFVDSHCGMKLDLRKSTPL